MNAGACAEGIEEETLALADGSIWSPFRKKKAMKHLLLCPSCRLLYEDFRLAEPEIKGPEKKSESRPFFSLNVLDGEAGLIPARKPTPTISCVQSQEKNAVEFSMKAGNEQMRLEVMRIGKTYSIDLNATITGTIDLVGPVQRDKVTPEDGTVKFKDLPKGNYVITTDKAVFRVGIKDE
jgi:hypothetical protein